RHAARRAPGPEGVAHGVAPGEEPFATGHRVWLRGGHDREIELVELGGQKFRRGRAIAGPLAIAVAEESAKRPHAAHASCPASSEQRSAQGMARTTARSRPLARTRTSQRYVGRLV